MARKYNRLQLTLMGYGCSNCHESSFYDKFGAYSADELKYLSYGKHLNDTKKYAIIKDNLDSFAYDWGENAFHNILNIYHFRHIRANSEHVAIEALCIDVKSAYLYWERWGVLKDGTILKPKETEKIISLLLAQAVEIDLGYSLNIEEFGVER